MSENPYRRLADRLNALPNGFPPTQDGTELRLLAKLFTPEEAALASELRLTPEIPTQVAARAGGEPAVVRKQLKEMVRRGLIAAGRAEGGLGYKLMPFIVGIYEMQVGTLDIELAQLFEDYYHQAFGRMLSIQPQVHRVIPVDKTVQTEMEVRPYESAAEIIKNARSWGVTDCICRKQKALVGDPCQHPIDVCMVFGDAPSIFDSSSTVRAITQEQAMQTLLRAAEAGLVHSVSNNQEGSWYICNCCSCSCGVLRGMVDLGIANVIARSAFVNRVDEDICIGCELCLPRCQFNALSVDRVARVDQARCVGCGVCVLACAEGALCMIRRPEDQVELPPFSETDWRAERAAARGLNMDDVL
jgi:Na+-translocating ferredoxin:NAD+ oxidoreductase subunit B